jgi:hypothetical protein
LDAGQVTSVFTLRYHGFQQVELNDATEAHIAAGPGKLHRQRGSPGTGTDNRNSLWWPVSY